MPPADSTTPPADISSTPVDPARRADPVSPFAELGGLRTLTRSHLAASVLPVSDEGPLSLALIEAGLSPGSYHATGNQHA
jgi:hypothetical protein